MPVIPFPAQHQSHDGQLYLSDAVVIRHSEDAAVASAAQLLCSHLQERLQLAAAVESVTETLDHSGAITLLVEPDEIESLAAFPNKQEAYELTISEEGVSVRANAPQGLLHGVQSLIQLLPPLPMEGDVSLDCLQVGLAVSTRAHIDEITCGMHRHLCDHSRVTHRPL